MLKANGITYWKERNNILTDVNIALPKQKIIGFLGPNAAGKSTLMQLLAGLRFLQNGEIELDGYTERDYILQHTVYMNHEFHFEAKWKVSQIVKHYQENCPRFNLQRFMGMAKQLDIDLTKQIRTLSRGTKERLSLSLTLSQDADYYFLDEPLSGVDMITREEIIRSMLNFADEQATIIISSHYMNIFEMLFEEVYFINHGEIIEQINCEAMREAEGLTLSEYYLKLYKGGVQ